MDSGVSKKMKIEDDTEQKWHHLMSDIVAHLNGANYECLAKYLIPKVKQFTTPSWVLKPAYEMTCCKCDKKACFIDVEDGLKHDWVPNHCPDHLPECLGGEKPIDYIPGVHEQAFLWDPMPYECTVCKATAIYKNTDDAENHGWWEDNIYWCPDHREEGVHYTSSVKLYCRCCRVHEVFEDLEEAYEHGWWKKGSLAYCSEHAYEAIRKHEQARSI